MSRFRSFLLALARAYAEEYGRSRRELTGLGEDLTNHIGDDDSHCDGSWRDEIVERLDDLQRQISNLGWSSADRNHSHKGTT